MRFKIRAMIPFHVQLKLFLENNSNLPRMIKIRKSKKERKQLHKVKINYKISLKCLQIKQTDTYLLWIIISQTFVTFLSLTLSINVWLLTKISPSLPLSSHAKQPKKIIGKSE